MSDNEIETFMVGDHRVRILQDTEFGTGDPRDADNLSVMVCLHRDYDLGDAPHRKTIKEYNGLEAALKGFAERLPTLALAARAFTLYVKTYHGATTVLPLYLLDHSGLSMTSRPSPFDPGGWDTSYVGFAFDTAHTREVTGCTPEHAADPEHGVAAEVRAYDAYLQGNVVGFVVEKEVTWQRKGDSVLRDEMHTWETVESCWGYLIVDHERDMEYVRSTARESVPE